MPLDEQLHHVTIDADDPIRPRVHLGDEDISRDLRAATVRVEAGKLPQVVLELSPLAGTRYAGIATIAVGVPLDLGPAAESFLAAIDPSELQAAALSRADLGDGPHATTEAILRQLRQWARGDA